MIIPSSKEFPCFTFHHLKQWTSEAEIKSSATKKVKDFSPKFFDKIFRCFSPARNFSIMTFLSNSGRRTLSLGSFFFLTKKKKKKNYILKHPDFSLSRKILLSSQFHDRFHCSPLVARYCTPVWHPLQVPKMTYLLSSCLLFYIQGSLVQTHKGDSPKCITASCLPVKKKKAASKIAVGLQVAVTCQKIIPPFSDN